MQPWIHTPCRTDSPLGQAKISVGRAGRCDGLQAQRNHQGDSLAIRADSLPLVALIRLLTRWQIKSWGVVAW